MTTLYDLVTGQNPYARMALAIVGLELQEVPRYRDATLVRGRVAADWRVSILTRCGGPNRTHFDTTVLDKHELFIDSTDMLADPTYGVFNFRFPDELAGLGKWIVDTETLEGDDRVDAWVTLFNKLNKLKVAFPTSKYVLSLKKYIAPVMQQLVDDGKIDVVDVS